MIIFGDPYRVIRCEKKCIYIDHHVLHKKSFALLCKKKFWGLLEQHAWFVNFVLINVISIP